MDNYYVYLYWRLDTNEIFYVGKGKNNRWKKLNRRNNHFTNIINKYPICVEIVKNNLTENEAFYWEEYIINELVFKYGYSIEIKGSNSTEKRSHLVNKTWGGEGTSGIHRYGKDAPMYGKYHSEETKNKMSEQRKGKYHSEETKNKMSAKAKLRVGRKSSSAKSVICITTLNIFFTAKEAIEYYNINSTGIVDCIKGRQKSAGKLEDGTPLVWRYLIWNHDRRYRIKE